MGTLWEVTHLYRPIEIFVFSIQLELLDSAIERIQNPMKKYLD